MAPGKETEKENPKGSTTVEDVFKKSEFLLRFDLQYSNRATSTTPTQLSAILEKIKSEKIATVSQIPLSSLQSCVPEMGTRDHFCLDDKQTVVSGTMTLGQYLSSTQTNTALLKDHAEGSVVLFTIFLVKNRIRPTPEELEKVGTGPDLKNELPDEGKLKGDPNKNRLSDGWNKSSLSGDQFAAGAGNITIHPADMTEKEWEVVVKNNILTHAYRIDTTAKSAVVARRPLFKLKRRQAEIFVVDSDQSPVDTTIPEFQVFDDSSVSVVEITNEAQESASNNSFSSYSVKASASGGIFGYTAGASAGVSGDHTEQSGSTTGKFESIMRVSYKFPRVIVYLDYESLEPTEECKKHFDDIAKQNDVSIRNGKIKAFKAKYGEVFSTSVQLGGYLYSTKLTSAVAASSSAEKMNRLAVSAGVNFSSPYVSGSVSTENSSGSGESSQKSSSSKHESLTWTAKGGDTLLCSNPPSWTSTVGNIYNWRVIERSMPRTIGDVLREMHGYEAIAEYLGTTKNGKVGGGQFDDDD
ncbi:hypothetical protein F4781DRAFT_170839 [Annulohypoxylon bovei var. microspora]|nr:hypothetical protein F4781DRAFT_170839 [Annulohypoxylon bovei var. microspora]